MAVDPGIALVHRGAGDTEQVGDLGDRAAGGLELVGQFFLREACPASRRSIRAFPPVAEFGSGLAFNGGPTTVSFQEALASVPNGWVYSTEVVDKAGQAPTSRYLMHACPALGQPGSPPPSGGKGSAGPVQSPLVPCLHKFSATMHTAVTYQPGSRFWPFQWAEMGVFLAAALALCGLTYWWLRRQYS